MGTARMGIKKNKSVVNEYGRSHDVKNMYIIDGSVFVTAGAVNPTSTIQAFALQFFLAPAVLESVFTWFIYFYFCETVIDMSIN